MNRLVAASWSAAFFCAVAAAPASGLVLEESADCGTGVVTAVTPVGGECVGFTPAQGNGPDNYEVQEGGTYTMTISGVTECDGDTITVFVQNSQTGNFCFNATGGAGEYTGVFTLPDQACNTFPISYKCGADAACDNADTWRAQGPSTGCGGVHLRSAMFDEGCMVTGTDEDCPPCPNPATAEPQPGVCDSLLTISPPIQGGTSTAMYDGDEPGKLAFFYYSAPGTPFPFMGCDIYLNPPFNLGAFILLDGNGDGQVTVSNNMHPCGQQVVVQAFCIDATGILEISNAVQLTFGS